MYPQMYVQEQDEIISRSQADSQHCAHHMGPGLLSLSFGMQDWIQGALPQVHNTALQALNSFKKLDLPEKKIKCSQLSTAYSNSVDFTVLYLGWKLNKAEHIPPPTTPKNH